MKVLKFKGKMPLKNKLLLLLAIILIIVAISVTIVYIVNEDAREWININILKKEVTEDDVATIQINSDKTQFICAYDKYIGVLSGGKLEIYNSYAYKTATLEIQISNPVFSSNGSYLAVGEKGGQKVYLISDRKDTVGRQSRRKYKKNKCK